MCQQICNRYSMPSSGFFQTELKTNGFEWNCRACVKQANVDIRAKLSVSGNVRFSVGYIALTILSNTILQYGCIHNALVCVSACRCSEPRNVLIEVIATYIWLK